MPDQLWAPMGKSVQQDHVSRLLLAVRVPRATRQCLSACLMSGKFTPVALSLLPLLVGFLCSKIHTIFLTLI